MKQGLEAGIFQFNVESEPELRALDQVAQAMGTQARVALRVNPHVDAKTHSKISTGRKGDKFGIDIEARHRDALHSAIMTGVRLALVNGMSKEAVVTAALDHARLSVPDAINALGAGKTVLVNIAEAKLQEAAGDALTAALRKAGAV